MATADSSSAKKKGRLDALERRLSAAAPSPDSRANPAPAETSRSDAEEGGLYAGVCGSVLRGPLSAELGLDRRGGGGGAGDVHAFLAEVLSATGKFKDVWGTIESRTRDSPTLLLDSRAGGARRRPKSCGNRSAKHLSRRRHRQLGTYDLPPEARKHALYRELHEMWAGYAAGLLADCRGGHDGAILSRLLTADLHGAVLAVLECKTASLVGTQGIMIRETAATFGLITPADELAVVPKAGSTFRLMVQNRAVTFFGNSLGLRDVSSSAQGKGR